MALHFATQNLALYHVDAVVWCVNYVKAHELLPDRLQDILSDEDSSVFTAEMLSIAAGSLRDLDRLAHGLYTIFFEPPSLDDRIINQYALFSLMSSPTGGLEEWLQANPGLFRRIIIPSELKWEVRDKLDQANITERVLFPGLDGLSLWLRRYYSPRNPEADPHKQL